MTVTQPAGAAPAPSAREPRWLDAEERAAWLSILRVTSTLPAALDVQLERDEGLSYFEYIVLAMLSEQPGLVLRMSQLAAVSNASPSRLSHVARRLEDRGLMRREPDPHDGRVTNAFLTDAGLATVRRAAPGHVAEVRSLVLDALSPAQLQQVRAANEAILARIDPDASTQPITPRPDPAAAPGHRDDQ